MNNRPGGTTVFHQNDIARIGQTLIDVAPCPEFAAGVAALCQAVGAPVRLPQRLSVSVALINDNGSED